ncbi:MAG: NAD-dependent succinate-semialdehyde dehydrogenase [Rhodothalassiaceae bacterium]
MPLDHSTLLRRQAYIDGQWCDAESGAVNEVRNPANGDVIATVPDMGAAETNRAIEAAARAMPDWVAKTAQSRADVLTRWADLMMQHHDDLARLMTLEQGKPVTEARGEIAYAANFLYWFAEEGRRAYGRTIPSHRTDTRILTLKQPVGVTAAITPWNFPSAMLTRKAGPALAAGCPVVAKPAEDTPLSALALAALAEEAGLPAGLFNIVTGDAKTIGETLTKSDIVRKITFTGSTEVGRLLMQQSASTIKKISLELGGNAPFLVFDDADLDAAVEGAVACKFRNAGQTCVCANRILVQAGVYDDFLKRFEAAVTRLSVGPGDQGHDIGPLINADAVEKVERHIADATSKGAELVVGGQPHDLGGTFFQPTIISGLTQQMQCFGEETFGPMAPIGRFDGEDDALALANATEYGLASYFYARDVGRIFRIAEALECGIVGVNTGIISTEVAPFGGVKQSGLGREGGSDGLEEFLETKYVSLTL